MRCTLLKDRRHLGSQGSGGGESIRSVCAADCDPVFGRRLLGSGARCAVRQEHRRGRPLGPGRVPKPWWLSPPGRRTPCLLGPRSPCLRPIGADARLRRRLQRRAGWWCRARRELRGSQKEDKRQAAGRTEGGSPSGLSSGAQACIGVLSGVLPAPPRTDARGSERSASRSQGGSQRGSIGGSDGAPGSGHTTPVLPAPSVPHPASESEEEIIDECEQPGEADT